MIKYLNIPEFEGYRAGNDGSIWSCRRSGPNPSLLNSWHQLKPWKSDRGRLLVGLQRNGINCRKQVHVLVMLAFKGVCPLDQEVCHRDGNPVNNNLKNLRYDTHINNQADMIKHKTKLLGDRHPIAKLNETKVKIIKRVLKETNCKFGIINLLARRFKVDKAIIARIRDNEAWKWVSI